MNSVAIAEMYDHLDILSVLHLHAKRMKQLVIYEGCEVLINMLSSHLIYHNHTRSIMKTVLLTCLNFLYTSRYFHN